MLQEVVVHYRIRKGLGPEYISRTYTLGFDDLPEEAGRREIIDMARQEFLRVCRSSIDYQLYGENWIIDEIELI